MGAGGVEDREVVVGSLVALSIVDGGGSSFLVYDKRGWSWRQDICLPSQNDVNVNLISDSQT